MHRATINDDGIEIGGQRYRVLIIDGEIAQRRAADDRPDGGQSRRDPLERRCGRLFSRSASGRCRPICA